MDVNRVGQGLVKCVESNKARQEIDFSEVLRNKEANDAAHTSQVEASSESGISGQPVQPKKVPDLVLIGTVTRKNPNVSGLLIKHPTYRKECWDILFSPINRQKPYTRIRSGTEIFLNPETREIVWGTTHQAAGAPAALANAEEPQPAENQKPADSTQALSDRLIGAVKPYFGKPYGEINCYELVVKGLTNLGVRYQGAGGLGRKLMVMAKEQGLPMNAYFNGEGLIAASGSTVYAKTLLSVRSPERQAAQVLKEIEPYLEKGQILSFSIHSRGHTGIVSRANDTWTLINSGEMDHALNARGLPKGVGEESLEAEVKDWFALAKARGESLRITLGRLNERQLLTYSDVPPEKRRKV